MVNGEVGNHRKRRVEEPATDDALTLAGSTASKPLAIMFIPYDQFGVTCNMLQLLYSLLPFSCGDDFRNCVSWHN